MTLSELQKSVYEWAKEKGWATAEHPAAPVPEQVALICSEACEALESWRNHEPVSFTKDGKPEGIGPEYADIIIRIANYAEGMGIDLEYEIARKMEFNKTRPYRHGGKAA